MRSPRKRNQEEDKGLNLRGYLELGFQDKAHQAMKDRTIFSNLNVHGS